MEEEVINTNLDKCGTSNENDRRMINFSQVNEVRNNNNNDNDDKIIIEEEIKKEKIKFGNIKIENFHNLNLIHSCNIFNLYESIYFKQSIQIPVYIYELKFLEPPFNKDKLIKKIEKKYIAEFDPNNINDKTKNELYIIGYDYDIDENILYLIYDNRKTVKRLENKIFDFSKFIKNQINGKFHKFNLRLFLLQTFYDIAIIVKELHKTERKISILHPSLIYFNYRYYKFGILDKSMEDFVNPINKANHFHICNFFGYFDLNAIKEIEESSEKNKSTDIVLLCLLLIYLLALSRDPNNTSYENIIYELRRDYLMENGVFTGFTSIIKDEEIRKFVIRHLNLDFSKISNINDFISNFELILLREYQRENCFRCNEILTENNLSEFKNFYFKCAHVICKNCLETEPHNCKDFISDVDLKDSYNLLIEKINRFSSRIQKVQENLNCAIEIDEKKIHLYYKSIMDNAFNNISNEHFKIERLIKMLEEKFDSISQYTEKIISKKFDQEIEKMISLMNDYNNKLRQVNSGIEKIISQLNYNYEQDESKDLNQLNSDSQSRFQSMSLAHTPMLTNLSPIKTTSNPPDTNKIISEFISTSKLEEFSKTVDEEIKNFEMFINNTEKFRNVINHNSNINFSLEKINHRAYNYFDEINNYFKKEFLNSVNSTFDEILRNLQSSDIDKNSLIRESSINNAFNQVIGSLNSKENKLFIFYDNKSHEDILKINFPLKNSDGSENKFRNILKNSRYVNMKTRIIITGGVHPDNEEKPTNFSFYLEYHSKLQNERTAKIISNMIFERDQHTMIKFNDFFVISIGGCQTNTCEIYNIHTNKWKQIPSLNKIRYNSSAFVYNQFELYVFFGIQGYSDIKQKNEYNFIHDIEKLNLYSNNSWELIQVSFHDNVDFKNFSLFGIIPNDEDIIILGGLKNYIPQIEYSLNFYKFNFLTLTLTRMENKDLSQSMSFHDTNFLKMKICEDGDVEPKPKYVSFTQEKILYAIDID